MDDIYIGLGATGERQVLRLDRANRHGLVAGATGTGKTVTLQGMAEQFSARGVPVFLADVKGDLAGIAMPGSPTFKHADAIEARAKQRKIRRLFVLTTRTAHWFIERGFQAAAVNALPRRRQDLYNYQRRSQVLIKRL